MSRKIIDYIRKFPFVQTAELEEGNHGTKWQPGKSESDVHGSAWILEI